MKKKLLLICAIVLFVGIAPVALADWDPGDDYKMHYPQLPDSNGWDIAFYSDMNEVTLELADDWKCTESGPVSDIHFWVSWRGDDVYSIQAVKAKIYSNNPLGPNGWSEPNTLLWSRNFQSSQFTVRPYGTGQQGWCDPVPPAWYSNDHLQYFQINIVDINDPYIQQQDEIYWLSLEIVAETAEGRVGWKTAIPPHFMDDAVWREAGGPWNELKDPAGTSLDLSFVITTEPNEPNNIKWIQKPDLTPNGIDIRVDRNDSIPRIMADDFLCTTTGLITDVHLWGSWKYNEKGNIQRIHLSIHSDDPVGTGGSDPDNQYSKPDILLWEKDFGPADFIESLYYTLPTGYEWWWDIANETLIRNGDTQVWKYDIYINPADAFRQEGDPCRPIIYWLDVYVETDTASTEFGWKTRRWPEHYQDDAVYADNIPSPPYLWQELRYPPTHEYEGNSIDMAFVITTGNKYTQPPDLSDTGIDVDATFDTSGAAQWQNQLLADDFPCTVTGRITDIHIWSSWYHDEMPDGNPNNVDFTLSIHADLPVGDPCNPNTYSIPGELLWMRNFLRGEFRSSVEVNEITEGYFVPCEPYYEFPADYTCRRYDFYIDPCEAFLQLGDPNHPIVYWLDVQARLPAEDNIRFGWKTSLRHWNDDAVFAVGDETNHGPWQELRYPPRHVYEGNSIDLAFAITTDAILPWRCYAGQPDEAEWVAAGEPNCWCWPRQCLGDADGKLQGKSPTIYWVSTNDLAILKSNWNIVGLVGNGNCADFDHKTQGKSPNIFRVSTNDLIILKTNWNIPGGPAPACSPGNCDPITCP